MLDIKLFIINKNIIFEVSSLAVDSIILSTERRGSPAKLEFKIARDVVSNSQNIAFYEGNEVQLIVDDINLFKGYVFSKKRTKEQIISVTAYDQTRYLTNKETLTYEYKTASEVIKMIANDYSFNLGEIEDTGFIIETRIEDNMALWDIILNALDITTINTKKLFVFYDDFGSLTLKSISKMILPFVLVSDENTLIDFNYKTDIGTDTYNKVKLYRDTKQSREVYIAKDTLNQLKWGVLQYSEKAPDHYSEAKIKQLADMILKQKNRIKRTLSVEDMGNINVRAGCTIYAKLNDIGETVDKMLIVEKCTHTFKNNEHTMKLDLDEWSD